jgi:hypothetical protein
VKDRIAFEQGYRQHLRWHAAKQDALPWFAWYIIDGDRKGVFVDGTFGATQRALAERPDLPGDAADFRATTGPYVEALGTEGLELLREASTSTSLERRKPNTKLQALYLEAGDASLFEETLRSMPALEGAAWYRGADHTKPQYILLISRTREASARKAIEHLPARLVRSEVWEYAPRLSLIPRLKSR